MFRPDTDLYLLKCPLEIDNNNQLTFTNATAQFNYFNSLPKIELEASTYQRKDSTVRYAGNIEDLYGYNYCMYRNHNYSDKWFYAFVTDMQWSSEAMTVVSLKTDVFQTWQFDITFKQCFVEREHVNNDTVGKHTVPENLEYGEYVCNAVSTYDIAKPNDGSTIIVLQATTNDTNTSGRTGTVYPSSTYKVHGGIPQGCYLIGLPMNESNIGKMATVIGDYDAAGKGESIIAITLMPYFANMWSTGSSTGFIQDTFYYPSDSWTARSDILNPISINTSLNGYVPKNKKLLTYPYNYLYVSNNAGVDVDYHWENFNGNPAFMVYTSIEQGGSVFLMPQNSFKSAPVTGDAWSEGIPAGKLPNISWTSDYYLNWQAVNGSNIKLQALSSAIGFAGSTFSTMAGGSPSSGIASLATDTANIMQQIKEAKITPPQAEGNVATGDISFASGHSKFTFRKMSIKAEYAEMIDKYFTAYGYRVNLFKLPNRTGRSNWNYVKTVGCNIEGDIPQSDMQEIKGIFDSGVTLWHKPNYFMDYSQDNNIV